MAVLLALILTGYATVQDTLDDLARSSGVFAGSLHHLRRGRAGRPRLTRHQGGAQPQPLAQKERVASWAWSQVRSRSSAGPAARIPWTSSSSPTKVRAKT